MPINLDIVSKFDPAGIGQARSGLDRLGGAFRNFAIAGAAALAGATVGLGYFAVEAMKAADESAKINRGLENMISNSEAFGKSTSSIKAASKTITDFTQQFALLTGISDETFNSLATSFLAAPNIAKMGADAVNNLIKISANAAAATGKDLESVGTALQKALENPATAMAKLQRANIFLTDEQKNTYQSMIDLGNEAEAQAYLIEELGKKYAGAAEAAASPWAKLKETFEMFKEFVGGKLMQAIEPLIPMLQTAVSAMIADPAFAQMIADTAKAFVDLAPSLILLMPDLVELATSVVPLLITLIPLLIPVVDFLTDAMAALAEMVAPLNVDLNNFWGMLFVLISPIGKLIEGVNQLNKYWGEFGTVIGGILSPLGSVISFFINIESWIQKVIDGWNDFIALVTGNPLPSSMPDIVRSVGVNAGLRPMATGGLVMRPTAALIGEAGPEAIIPLDRMGSMGSNIHVTVNTVAGDPMAIERVVLDAISRASRRGTTRLVA
jgi:hypothetical protein